MLIRDIPKHNPNHTVSIKTSLSVSTHCNNSPSLMLHELCNPVAYFFEIKPIQEPIEENRLWRRKGRPPRKKWGESYVRWRFGVKNAARLCCCSSPEYNIVSAGPKPRPSRGPSSLALLHAPAYQRPSHISSFPTIDLCPGFFFFASRRKPSKGEKTNAFKLL